MERFGWLGGQPQTALVGQMAGTYTAQMGEAEAVVKLWFSPEGYVQGQFSAEGQSLEIRGGFLGRSQAIYGFLLEQSGGTPVAMFRAQPGLHGLTLQLDVPDFDELMDLCNPQSITLNKQREIPSGAGLL